MSAVEREMPCTDNAAAPTTANETPALSSCRATSARSVTLELLDASRVAPAGATLCADQPRRRVPADAAAPREVFDGFIAEAKRQRQTLIGRHREHFGQRLGAQRVGDGLHEPKCNRDTVRPMHALLLGATGLVGRGLLAQLLRDGAFAKVTVIARKATGEQHSKLEEHVLDLGEMQAHPHLFRTGAIFCALGTTIKTAGSQERFRVVDYDYPLMAARLGKEQGATHYLLVSALGANANSRIFYNRVKGEVERDLLALNYPKTTIARPSLLLGERTEFRPGERGFAQLGWLMPPAYKPIHGRDVASALVDAAKTQESGVQILESRAMRTRRK